MTADEVRAAVMGDARLAAALSDRWGTVQAPYSAMLEPAGDRWRLTLHAQCVCDLAKFAAYVKAAVKTGNTYLGKRRDTGLYFLAMVVM